MLSKFRTYLNFKFKTTEKDKKKGLKVLNKHSKKLIRNKTVSIYLVMKL